MSRLNIGLVLAGGGAKGAYQAGVFRALHDLDVCDSIGAVSGTSIGALNAVLFATNDEDAWKNSWENISYAIFRQNEEKGNRMRTFKIVKDGDDRDIKGDILKTIMQNDIGLLSQTALSKYIKEQLDFSQFRKSGKAVYACAYNTSKGEPRYFKLNDCSDEMIMKILLASSAIPFVFKPIRIGADYYADGGVLNPLYENQNIDNVPIAPLMDHSCDAIVVVYLSYRDRVDRSLFSDTPVIELFPSQPLDPASNLGTLDFTSETLRQRMGLGYRDAMSAFAPLVVAMLKGLPMDGLLERQREDSDRLYRRMSSRTVSVQQ